MRLFLIAACALQLQLASAQCPTPYATTTTATVCQGVARTIRIADSQVGNTYELRVGLSPNDVSAGLPPVAGTNVAITWSVIAESTITYTVRATNNTSGCQAMMIGSATLTVNPSSPQYEISAEGQCVSATTIYLSGSTVGVNYMLRRGTSNQTATSQPGTGGVLSWTNITTAGVYSVFATNTTTSCTRVVTGTGTVTVLALPTSYNVSGTATVCQGLSRTITLANSQASSTYELRIGLAPDDVSAGQMPKVGTGAALIWTVSPVTTTRYTVRATDYTTGCTRIMGSSANITISASTLTLYTVSGIDNCGSSTVNLSGSQTGVVYRLKRDNAFVMEQNGIQGTGAPISWTSQSFAGIYTVEGIRTSTGCVRFMSGEAQIIRNTVVYDITNVTSPCSPDDPVITLESSQLGVIYQAKVGTGIFEMDASDEFHGTGMELHIPVTPFGLPTRIEARNVFSGCTRDMEGEVTPLSRVSPSVLTFTTELYCAGQATVNLATSEQNVTYLLRRGGVSYASKGGTGGPLTWAINDGGTYTMTATHNQTSCMRAMNGIANITERPALLTMVLPTPACQWGQVRTITLPSSEAGVSYQLMAGGDGQPTHGEHNPQVGTGGTLAWDIDVYAATRYFIVATGVSTGCFREMGGAGYVTIAPEIQVYSVSGSGCAAPSSGNIVLSDSQTGVSYQLVNATTMLNVGPPKPGTGSQLAWQPAAGLYQVNAFIPNTSCTAAMTGTGTMLSPPLTFPVTPSATTICQGQEVRYTLQESRPGHMYQLRKTVIIVIPGLGEIPIVTIEDERPGHPAGLPITLEEGSVEEGGIYSIRVTNQNSGCSRNFTEEFPLTVNHSPAQRTLIVNGSACIGVGTAGVSLVGSDPPISYQLYAGQVAQGAPQIGNGSALVWNVSQPGGYRVVGTDPSTGCSREMLGYLNITFPPTAFNFDFVDGPEMCDTVDKAVVLSDSEEGVQYNLMYNGQYVNGPWWYTTGTGEPLQWTIHQGGTYTVLATNPYSSCTTTIGNLVPTVHPAPATYTITTTGNCFGYGLQLSGSDAPYEYSLFLNDELVETQTGYGGPLSFGVSGAGVVTIDRSGVCPTTRVAAQILPSSRPIPFHVMAGPTVCDINMVTIELDSSEYYVNYQVRVRPLFLGTYNIGSPVPGNGGLLSLPIPEGWVFPGGSGVYTVRATNSFTGCSVTMLGDTFVFYNGPCPGGRIRSSGEVELDEEQTDMIWQEGKLGIYPNPASQAVTFVFPPNINEGRIQLVNMLGGEVGTHPIAPGQSKLTVDVTRFDAGMFLVRHLDGTKITVGKMVKRE